METKGRPTKGELKPNKEKTFEAIQWLKDNSAVYIYTCTISKKVLYVGQTSSIKRRFRRHYKKLYKDRSVKDFDFNDEFFQTYQGNITIYWLEMNNRGERLQLEAALIYSLDPVYEGWKHKHFVSLLQDIE